jgi:peptide deformylase
VDSLEIITFPDSFLKQSAQPVTQIDGRLQELVDKMAMTMYQAPGVGLAAVQVRVDQQLIVFDVSPQDNGRKLNVLINPQIVASEGIILSENEGCLSVPEFRADVQRAQRVLVTGEDREGKPIRIEAEGMLAIVLQHEIDHLNGKLFIDHISALKRQMYTRRMQKKMKHGSK